MKVHASFDALLAGEDCVPQRMFAFSTKGARPFGEIALVPGDWLVFGSETRGLPDELRARFAPQQRVRLPMRAGNRSLNLSNAVAIAVYEGWRQNGYRGGA
jgi:tRNA (cytidine/uridine-2'-O-)-methyltransferase